MPEDLGTGERRSVSFLIPTLNRGRYVRRAVRSCLAAATTAAVQAEVIVLDSESDDGSWEGLHQEFGSDPRVRLMQNRRGSGPTRSWLDAANAAEGDLATFVWSDDYVAPNFLTELMPGMSAGAALAVGAALVRDIDCEDPMPEIGTTNRVEVGQIIAGYLGVRQRAEVLLPMSPACALFSGPALHEWRDRVVEVSQASSLRHRLMWTSAVGPDLLLFQVALEKQRGPVYQTQRPIVQFSAHPGSITIGSSQWRINSGYWLARSTMMRSEDIRKMIAPKDRLEAEIGTIGGGLAAATEIRTAQDLSPGARLSAAFALSRETMALVRVAAGDVGTSTLIRGAFARLRRRHARRNGDAQTPSAVRS